MRLITVIAGAIVAFLLTLDLSASVTSATNAPDTERPVENLVREQPSPSSANDAGDVPLTSSSEHYHNSSVDSDGHHRKARNADYIADGKDIWREFFHSLYVDRTFNSSFALNVPLFTLTIPGYGRGVKTQTALSALNVGKFETKKLFHPD